MKKKLVTTVFVLAIACQVNAQYFQRSFNRDYTNLVFRDELLNSGIRTRANFAGGNPGNYYHVGIGVSRLNAVLPSPDNRADWVRFIRLNKTGATVSNNRGLEFRDSANKAFHAAGNSIAEISTSAGTGGYIAVGSVGDNVNTGTTVPGGSDALYTVLNSGGAVTAAYRIDFGKSFDIGWCIRPSVFMPGTWLICGEATKFPTGVPPYTNCFVARVDAAGNILWCFTYNFDPTMTGNLPTANCIAKQLAEDPVTGDIYTVGLLKDFTGTNGVDGLIFKVNSVGGVIGTFLWHAGNDDQFHGVRFTADGNIIVGGFTDFSFGGTTGYNMLLLKVSPLGIILFQNLLTALDAAGVSYESKCYDLIERKNTVSQMEYFLFGPVYYGTTPVQTVYKADGAGFGINSYAYNKMKYDVGFGIDYADNSFAKPGLSLFSSTYNSGGVYSDSHIMKTYFNGATCTNYCPLNPPQTTPLQITPKNPNPQIGQNCSIQKLNFKSFNYQSVLNCNQGNVSCGSNARNGDDSDGLKAIDELIVYPNPASDLITISWNVLSEGMNRIEVIDVTGKMVMQWNEMYTEGMASKTIDISGMVPGYLIIRVVNNNGEWKKPVLRQ